MEKCELYSGSHDGLDEIPEAVGLFNMYWESVDGLPWRYERHLCADCLKSKRSEFAQLRGDGRRASITRVQYRWIVMLYQPWCDGELTRASSLAEAKRLLSEFRSDTGNNDVTASLYPYSEEDWAAAREYEHIGNPFNYPSKLLTVGKRGGIVEERV